MSPRGGMQCEDCVEERPTTVIACQRRKGREEEDRNKKPITATTPVGVNDVHSPHTSCAMSELGCPLNWAQN